ncbi:hypothetical protein C9374_000378 [Naegleria lovaniensis]|uniref:Cytochrome P450 n=1 Tax=Naegleria lovaniensis TaxID=51637 RepID=A0AA88GCS6_NAELO|nr:uncharacterized protein C9374_000378 [Naegleria lovaniensis]KAG2370580.1 hypothetical protein C9374_000378 [Naegleria lovaniensis]
MLKEVRSKKQHLFNKDDKLKVIEIFGESILSAPDTERWKKRHRVLSAAFSRGNLEFMCKVAVKTTDQLIKTKWEILLQCSGAQQNVQYWSDTLDEFIVERKKKIEKGEEISQQDLLSLMVKANIENNDLTTDHVKSNALLLFLAGTETSSNTLQWVIYELAKRPEIQKRAHQEVDEVLQNGKLDPSFQLYDSFVFCNAIIHETLRCHPPVGSLSKRCIKNTQLGKFEIPKGTAIHPLITQANKNDQVWELHHTFHPDRFGG